jgi:hypothetical protein
MDSRGVQNAQLQGPQGSTSETAASWWSTYAEGGDGMEGLSRF